MGTLYENIKALCDERGIRGGKMCVDLGLSKSMMTGLKKGQKKTIQIETAQKIADYFGVPVDDLLNTENNELSFDNVDVDGLQEIQVITEQKRPLEEAIATAERQKKEPAPTNGNGQRMYDLRVLTWFHSLPEEKRQAILALGDAPAELRGDPGYVQSSKSDPPRTK